jgi:O-acetyl-ADP-ribose deacetylase (regulator of RNase III)
VVTFSVSKDWLEVLTSLNVRLDNTFTSDPRSTSSRTNAVFQGSLTEAVEAAKTVQRDVKKAFDEMSKTGKTLAAGERVQHTQVGTHANVLAFETGQRKRDGNTSPSDLRVGMSPRMSSNSNSGQRKRDGNTSPSDLRVDMSPRMSSKSNSIVLSDEDSEEESTAENVARRSCPSSYGASYPHKDTSSRRVMEDPRTVDDSNTEFFTPTAKIKVQVLRGDLTQQKSEAIVNPANKHLLHSGGAAKAIADAAGYKLMQECEQFIAKRQELRTSEVMHTTSGRLKFPIRFVIHAVGPSITKYPDPAVCKHLLQKTFFNCFMHANDALQVESLAVPAISSGTDFFSVEWL